MAEGRGDDLEHDRKAEPRSLSGRPFRCRGKSAGWRCEAFGSERLLQFQAFQRLGLAFGFWQVRNFASGARTVKGECLEGTYRFRQRLQEGKTDIVLEGKRI